MTCSKHLARLIKGGKISMDLFDWILNNGTVLDGTVIVRFIMIGLIFELFGILSNWVPRAVR